MDGTIKTANRPLARARDAFIESDRVDLGSPSQRAPLNALSSATAPGDQAIDPYAPDHPSTGSATSDKAAPRPPWPAAVIAHGPPDGRSLMGAAIGAALYFVLALASLSLGRFDAGLSAIWLPNAAAVVFLLRARLSNEAGFAAAILTASFLAFGVTGSPLGLALLLSLANLAYVLVVTWLTRRWCGPRPDMRRLATLVRFVWFGGMIGPLLCGGVAFLALWLRADNAVAWNGAINWFLSQGMGLIVLGPAALLLSEALSRSRPPNPQALAESAALLACSLLCAVLVFGQGAYPLLFLILPMTLVHAFRLGSVGAALHAALVGVVAGAMTMAGHGPIVEASASPEVRLHLIQAFVAANALTGLPIAAILAGRDRLTDALIEGRRDLALLANSISDAVLKLDRDGVCTYASPAVRDVLGEEPEVFIGRPLSDLTQEDAGQRIADVLARLLAGDSDKERLTYRRRLDDDEGAPVFIEADCAITCDPTSGNKEGVIVSARDVTERVELEMLLTRARRHAEKAAGAKSDFLANMSHEIRTPMNGVLGFAELMLQGELDPEQRRHTEMIVESGRTMMLLLNDILDLSKIEAGQIVIDTGPIDVHATLDECVALHRQSAKKKAIALTLEHEMDAADPPADKAAAREDAKCENLLPTVVTDGLRLRQIALNLIGNAVKFTESGEVRVSYWTTQGELFVRVRDTGIGISPNKIDKIFRPFTQGDNDTARRYGGTGLGLSISQQLAELLGGRITVESVRGVGSTFTLALPAKRIEAGNTATDHTTPALPKDMPQHARILLVEDHEVNRMLVTEMLERCGQSVASAHDGNEAIAMVMDSVMRERPFDLILMDVQMPDCDGYEATRAIREGGIGAEVLPIIALTANAFPEDVAAAREAGMQAHLAKPIEFANLARALQRWLPTRIVETPMDRDVAIPPQGIEIGADATDATDATDASTARDRLFKAWLRRRSETVEAIRKGLADGLIRNDDKRRTSDREDRDALLRMVHKLAGTAASFGEADLGDHASQLERAMSVNEPGERCEEIAFALLALADEPSDTVL